MNIFCGEVLMDILGDGKKLVEKTVVSEWGISARHGIDVRPW